MYSRKVDSNVDGQYHRLVLHGSQYIYSIKIAINIGWWQRRDVAPQHGHDEIEANSLPRLQLSFGRSPIICYA